MNQDKLKAWAYAKKKYRLSHETIKMAQSLGLNPKKFGKIGNHRQEPWKAPLSVFIREIYEKQQAKIAAKQAKVYAQQKKLDLVTD
jgi:hypothetical protein